MNQPQHQWSYKQRGSESAVGPIDEPEFVGLVKSGTIDARTLVSSPTRTKGKWVEANRIPALAKFFTPQIEGMPDAKATPNANPYRVPDRATVAANPQSPHGRAENIIDYFQPLKSAAVIWLLRATMLVLAVHGFLFWWFFEYGYSRNSSFASAQTGIFILQVVLTIATGILFLRWKYQAYKNLQVACSTRLKSTPGWIVGCYFIPLLNFFRPVLAMNEIQSCSRANLAYSAYAWWVLYLLAVILGRVAQTAPGNNNRAGHFLTIVAICLALFAGFLLLKLVTTISEKHRRYAKSSEIAASIPMEQWQDTETVAVPWHDRPRSGVPIICTAVMAGFGWSAVSSLDGGSNSVGLPSPQAMAIPDSPTMERLEAETGIEQKRMQSAFESSTRTPAVDVSALVSELVEPRENGRSSFQIRQELASNGIDDKALVQRLANLLHETTDGRKLAGILTAMSGPSYVIADHPEIKAHVASGITSAGRYVQAEQLEEMNQQATSLILDFAQLPASIDLLGKLASIDDRRAGQVLTALLRMKDKSAVAAASVKIVRENDIDPRHLRDTESQIICEFLWEGKLAGKTRFSQVTAGNNEASRRALTKAMASAVVKDRNQAVTSLMTFNLHKTQLCNRQTLPRDLMLKLDHAISTQAEKHLGDIANGETVYQTKRRQGRGEGPLAFLDLAAHLGGREVAIAIAQAGNRTPSIFERYEPIRDILLSVKAPETYDAIATATAFHGTGRSLALYRKIGQEIESAFVGRLRVEQDSKPKNRVEEGDRIKRIRNLVEVIKQVGTAKSLPALEELANSKNGLLSASIKHAIEKIGDEKGAASQPNASKTLARKPVHVFIFTGQSNISHMDPETGFLPEAKTLFRNEEIVHFQVAKGGAPLCRWVKEWDDIAERKGMSAKLRREFVEGQDDEFYQQILQRYRSVLAKHPQPTSVTLCWMQGERDANAAGHAAYKEALKLLLSKLRRDLKSPELNVVVGRIGDYGLGRPSCVAVRKAQREIALEDPRGAWIDCDDLNDRKVNGKIRNSVTFTKIGYQILGRRFARQAHALVTGKEPAQDGKP